MFRIMRVIDDLFKLEKIVYGSFYNYFLFQEKTLI